MIGDPPAGWGVHGRVTAVSNIGAAIKEARTAMGWTLASLGHRTGLSAAYLSDIERGARLPPAETVLKIANELPDVDSIEWLWTWLKDEVGHPTAVEMANWVTATHERTTAAPATELGR